MLCKIVYAKNKWARAPKSKESQHDANSAKRGAKGHFISFVVGLGFYPKRYTKQKHFFYETNYFYKTLDWLIIFPFQA